MEQKDLVILIILISIFLLIFIGGSILYVLQSRRKKIENEKEKSMLSEIHTQELLSTQLEMQIQTMQHIGREIHDNVGQKLTLASLYTQQLAYENKAPLINDKIESISQIINESLAELRQLSKTLTDDRINENNIVALLLEECSNINKLKKCHIVFNNPQSNIELPYQTKSILLRITQEFLQNSMKYAECKNIQVSLSQYDSFITLLLKDDGKGFDTYNNSSKGIGLANMKKRTEMIGGTFNLDSKNNSGTTLIITIPINK